MKRLTIEAIHSQLPRETALEIMQSVRPDGPEQFVRLLRNWILIHMDIVDEFEELLISPCILIQNIRAGGKAYGDCDDIAMLAASILSSIGAMTRLTAVFPDVDGSFQHVICEYKFPRRDDWEYFDGTIGNMIPVIQGESLSVDIVS